MKADEEVVGDRAGVARGAGAGVAGNVPFISHSAPFCRVKYPTAAATEKAAVRCVRTRGAASARPCARRYATPKIRMAPRAIACGDFPVAPKKKATTP